MSRPLPADHVCRTDDLVYTTVDAWLDDHRGKVPLQAAVGLSQYMKRHGCSFAEAWTALIAPGGSIILLEGDPADPTDP